MSSDDIHGLTSCNNSDEVRRCVSKKNWSLTGKVMLAILLCAAAAALFYWAYKAEKVTCDSAVTLACWNTWFYVLNFEKNSIFKKLFLSVR